MSGELKELNRNNYPDIILNTELGPMHIIDYINHIREDGRFGGKLEISIASNLYNINMETYLEINNNNEIIGYNFINYYNNNNENNERQDLMILTNINNKHFRIGYDSYKEIDNNFIINNIKINQNIVEDNKSKNDSADKEIGLSANLKDLEIIKNILNDLRNLTLDDIIKLYKSNIINKIGLDDIYFYLFHYKIHGNILINLK